MIPGLISNNPDDMRIVVSDDLNLKEDEAIICVGIAGGKNWSNIAPISPIPYAWKTLRFNLKDLNTNNFEEDILWIFSTALRQSAKLHGWFGVD